jgi:hypothetical protein
MSDEELRRLLMNVLAASGERRKVLEEYLTSRKYPGYTSY